MCHKIVSYLFSLDTHLPPQAAVAETLGKCIEVSK